MANRTFVDIGKELSQRETITNTLTEGPVDRHGRTNETLAGLQQTRSKNPKRLKVSESCPITNGGRRKSADEAGNDSFSETSSKTSSESTPQTSSENLRKAVGDESKAENVVNTQIRKK